MCSIHGFREYAVHYVQGCQQVSNKTGDKPFPKMLSYLKRKAQTEPF